MNKISFLLLVLLASFQNPSHATGRIIHIFVALCDNDSQGIVPVPKKIGNGNDPDNNLYWGCGYGVRTFFRKSAEWKSVATIKNPEPNILERLVFKHNTTGAWLVADAYQGNKIKNCVIDFLDASAGIDSDTIRISNGKTKELLIMEKEELVCYVGHDGLMDFSLSSFPKKKGTMIKDAMILACISKSYFKNAIKDSGANPLLWTTGLMCPEAYTLKAAIDGWLLKETGSQIRERAAQAYNQYLKCGMKGARGLFATGW